MPLKLTTFGVGELIDEVMAELEPIIKRSNLDGDAPRCAATCRR